MGEVYRARDTVPGRDVAIKVLASQVVADGDRLRRFDREARMLAALNHPNIAQIFGLERQDPGGGPENPVGPFIVMELVEGETLADALSAGRRPAPGALRVQAEGQRLRMLVTDALATHDGGHTSNVEPLPHQITASTSPCSRGSRCASSSPTIRAPARRSGRPAVGRKTSSRSASLAAMTWLYAGFIMAAQPRQAGWAAGDADGRFDSDARRLNGRVRHRAARARDSASMRAGSPGPNAHGRTTGPVQLAWRRTLDHGVRPSEGAQAPVGLAARLVRSEGV